MLEVASSEHARIVLRVRTTGESGEKGLPQSLPLPKMFVRINHTKVSNGLKLTYITVPSESVLTEEYWRILETFFNPLSLCEFQSEIF